MINFRVFYCQSAFFKNLSIFVLPIFHPFSNNTDIVEIGQVNKPIMKNIHPSKTAVSLCWLQDLSGDKFEKALTKELIPHDFTATYTLKDSNKAYKADLPQYPYVLISPGN